MPDDHVREGDMRTLICSTEQCFVRVAVEFLASDAEPKRVRHDVTDFVPNGGTVCLKMRSWSWNTDEAIVAHGRCSC